MVMLDELDDAALDALPFGVVCLDDAMKVVRMNRTESERSGIQRWRAVGRGYFQDVAPGPTNRALAEHVAAFAQDGRARTTLAHTFHRRAGADPTQIELRKEHGHVYLVIHR
jgi:photoactive yellow protein